MPSGNSGGMNMAQGSSMPMNQSTAMTDMNMNPVERIRSGGNLTLGYHFHRSFSANTGGGISASHQDDGNTMGMLDVTVARATYTISGLALSAGFSLMSDHMKNDGAFGAPTLPFIGLRAGYVFGNPFTLGDLSATFCH